MKRGIQILAAALAVATLGFWFAKGANVGWTKDRIEVIKSIDPVTGIAEREWQDKYMPGLNVLGGGLAIAGALFVGSLFIRKQTKQQQTQNS